MLWLSAIKINRPHLKVNKYYPLPQIIVLNFITLRDIFYLTEVILADVCLCTCIALFLYLHFEKQAKLFLNRLLLSVIGTIDAHPAAFEKRDLKSNVTVYCIIYSSVDNINCYQFQKASCFCWVYCIDCNRSDTVNSNPNPNPQCRREVRTCQLKGYLNEKVYFWKRKFLLKVGNPIQRKFLVLLIIC